MPPRRKSSTTPLQNSQAGGSASQSTATPGRSKSKGVQFNIETPAAEDGETIIITPTRATRSASRASHPSVSKSTQTQADEPADDDSGGFLKGIWEIIVLIAASVLALTIIILVGETLLMMAFWLIKVWTIEFHAFLSKLDSIVLPPAALVAKVSAAASNIDARITNSVLPTIQGAVADMTSDA